MKERMKAPAQHNGNLGFLSPIENVPPSTRHPHAYVEGTQPLQYMGHLGRPGTPGYATAIYPQAAMSLPMAHPAMELNIMCAEEELYQASQRARDLQQQMMYHAQADERRAQMQLRHMRLSHPLYGQQYGGFF